MTLREKALASAIGSVLLYAALAGYWFVGGEKAWKKAYKAYTKSKNTFVEEEKLIAEKSRWDDEYAAERSQMPSFDNGSSTVSTWIDQLDLLVKKHHIFVRELKPGKEIDAGEVMELSIEVPRWEGSLEALVRFMYELETTKEGMFDIRSLNFRPNNSKKGYLTGNFTLTCAYMRNDE
jgi:hypothetical protein